ncbi:TIGR02679 domain-containing protein [Nonomuraea typhae]|uniref:TIGR02679 domain-containing protein n=1 Tax=Nonomuraea typhae TaxID=2603600 RepID=UPI0012F7EB0C|nr:TIGR02679 domain-containing protein [Nonomuraea typhae]
MAGELPAGLAEWVARPGPAKVVAAVRERALRSASTEIGTLKCALDDDERREVGRLLGVRWALSGRPVLLRDLAEALTRYGLTSLGLAESVYGLIVPRSEERRRMGALAEQELEEARALLRSGDAPVAWLADPVLPRAGDGTLLALVRRVVEVWLALPAEPQRLAALAARVCGDAHALDHDRLLGRAVARLAADVHGLERPTRPGHAWRAAWRAVGVLCNEVSSRVLVLNLPLAGTAPAVAHALSTPGEPVWLTARSLTGGWEPAFPFGVFVCENPAVVETAADQLGSACPPLVCTDGIATTAALGLIGGLASAGCAVRARADFDQAGFVIVDQIRAVAPEMELWRFDAATYCAVTGEEPIPGGMFTPEAVSRPVHEEAILHLLLEDLRREHADPDRPRPR